MSQNQQKKIAPQTKTLGFNPILLKNSIEVELSEKNKTLNFSTHNSQPKQVFSQPSLINV
jgi:hypothetical protein